MKFKMQVLKKYDFLKWTLKKWTRASLPALAAVLLTTPAVQSQVLINEFDYDDAGGDDLTFVELINVGAGPVDLDGSPDYFVIGLSAGDGLEYGRWDLTGTIDANGGLAVLIDNGDQSAGLGTAPPGVAVTIDDTFVLHVLSYEHLEIVGTRLLQAVHERKLSICSQGVLICKGTLEWSH